MPLFRHVYKRFSEVKGTFILVEEDYEAASFQIEDSNLVFYDADGAALAARPIGSWASVDLVVPEKQSSIIT